MESLKLNFQSPPEYEFNFLVDSVNKKRQNKREALEDEILAILETLNTTSLGDSSTPRTSLLSPISSDIPDFYKYLGYETDGKTKDEEKKIFFASEREKFLTSTPSPSVSEFTDVSSSEAYPEIIKIYDSFSQFSSDSSTVTELGNKIDAYRVLLDETDDDEDLDFTNLGSQGNTKIIEKKYDYNTLAPSASSPAITYAPYESPYDPFSVGKGSEELLVDGAPDYHYEFVVPINAKFDQGVYIAMEVNLQDLSETDLLNNKLSLFSSCGPDDGPLFSCCLDFGSKKILFNRAEDQSFPLPDLGSLNEITNIEIIIYKDKEDSKLKCYVKINDFVHIDNKGIRLASTNDYIIKTLGIDYSVDGNGFKKLNSYFPGVINNFKLYKTFLDSPIDAVTIDALQAINAELERKIRVLQQTETTAESQQIDYSELTAPALSTLLGMSPDSVSDIYQFNELSQEYEKLMNQKDNILKQNSKHEIILRSSQNLQKKIKFYHSQIKILKVVTLITHIILAIIVVVAIMYRMLAK